MTENKENVEAVVENTVPVDINVASDTDQGVVQISNNVIAMVVKKYTMEIEGVVRFQQPGMLDGLFDVLSKRPIDRSIELDLQDTGAIITLTLIMKFGVCIPDVCKKIQTTIKEKVETLTGYPVAKVNVNVVDLDDAEAKADKKAKGEAEAEPALEDDKDGEA